MTNQAWSEKLINLPGSKTNTSDEIVAYLLLFIGYQLRGIIIIQSSRFLSYPLIGLFIEAGKFILSYVLFQLSFQ